MAQEWANNVIFLKLSFRRRWNFVANVSYYYNGRVHNYTGFVPGIYCHAACRINFNGDILGCDLIGRLRADGHLPFETRGHASTTFITNKNLS